MQLEQRVKSVVAEIPTVSDFHCLYLPNMPFGREPTICK